MSALHSLWKAPPPPPKKYALQLSVAELSLTRSLVGWLTPPTHGRAPPAEEEAISQTDHSRWRCIGSEWAVARVRGKRFFLCQRERAEELRWGSRDSKGEWLAGRPRKRGRVVVWLKIYEIHGVCLAGRRSIGHKC